MSKYLSKEKPNQDELKYFINEKIKADRIFVIDQNAQNLGLILRSQALMRAQESGLDLVQVGEKDGVPVAKLIDFGKFLYTKKKQLNDAKKHQKIIVVKEIKLRPNIGEQDYKTKLNQAVEFFADGNKVKVTLQFRGRETTMMSDVGTKFFTRIFKDFADRDIGTIAEEKESRGGSLWTKILYVKNNK